MFSCVYYLFALKMRHAYVPCFINYTYVYSAGGHVVLHFTKVSAIKCMYFSKMLQAAPRSCNLICYLGHCVGILDNRKWKVNVGCHLVV
jgi:hypothetical protein